MNNFDLKNYYDFKNHTFKTYNSEQEIIDYLNSNFENILLFFNNLLYQEYSRKYKDELQLVNIVLDPITRKESPYKVELKDIIKSCKKSSVQIAKNFANRHENVKKERIENPNFERDIRYELEELVERIEESDLVSKIKRYLYGQYIAGEFHEKGLGTIVLYLNVICDSHNPNEKLLSTFVHELFHAYHYLAANKKFKSVWNYTSFQNATIKEGLAVFAEILYSLQNNATNNVVNRLQSFLKTQAMDSYPYASFNLIWEYYQNVNRFISAHLFYTSLLDMGEAYNTLLYMQGALNYRNKINLNNLTITDIHDEVLRQDELDVLRNINTQRIYEICKYIKEYKCHEDIAYYANENNMEYLFAPKNTFNLISTEQIRSDLEKANVSFADFLSEKLKERNMTDSECYKRARISKGTFNKIINERVKPKRENVALLALSLNLNPEEYDEFLRSAGYARSRDVYDVLNIIGYYIENDGGNTYDIDAIEDVVKQITGKYLANYYE